MNNPWSTVGKTRSQINTRTWPTLGCLTRLTGAETADEDISLGRRPIIGRAGDANGDRRDSQEDLPFAKDTLPVFNFGTMR